MYSVCLVTSFTLERCKLQHINQVGIKTEQIEKLREALHHPRITLSPHHQLMILFWITKLPSHIWLIISKAVLFGKLLLYLPSISLRFENNRCLMRYNQNAAWADFNVFTSFIYIKIHTHVSNVTSILKVSSFPLRMCRIRRCASYFPTRTSCIRARKNVCNTWIMPKLKTDHRLGV